MADRLKQDVKILCLIVTYPAHHTTHALPVYRTWARRCSRVIFVTNNATSGDQVEEVGVGGVQEEAKEMPFLVVPEADGGKDALWNKTKFAFLHAHTHHLHDYDWFLKADDDTYIVMENLRYWLHDKNPEEDLYYGCHFTSYAPKGYMSGGAGYVLSRGALKSFYRVTSTVTNTTTTFPYGEEDLQMGTVLAAAGVYPSDSRDSEGRPRFFPLDAGFMVEPREKDNEFWYWQMIAQSHPTGLQCCSPYTISFHYIYGSLLYELEFLIYHLKLFGVSEEARPC